MKKIVLPSIRKVKMTHRNHI